MERAIRRGAGEEGGESYEEVRYEGYGPGGVAVIDEALTDNRNRTASEVRAAFNKHGGSLGESGSVSYMFDHVGLIHYQADVASGEEMFEAALEAGAEDVVCGEAGHEVTCAPDDLSRVRDALERRFGAADVARLDWKPNVSVAIDEHQAETVFKLLAVLDDNDDVQRVMANYEVSDEVLERLSA
jgi:YebC/PmpR family DNA-binding regulatory protein